MTTRMGGDTPGPYLVATLDHLQSPYLRCMVRVCGTRLL